MGRIEDVFARYAEARRPALVAYLCIGDPSLEESVELALACVEAGADVLELGTPFSDPTADGPAIARASQRALKRGGGLRETIEAARRIRAKSQVPMVLFGYFNPIVIRGEEATLDDAQAAGIDALLIVDLPIDEAGELAASAKERGLGLVPLVAPTTTDERLKLTRDAAHRIFVPFVYNVSTTGVTGGAAALADLEAAGARALAVRAAIGRPTVIGFGIDSPERARAAGAHADGVVVGSAIVRTIEAGKSRDERLASVRTLVASLRAAL